MTAKSRDSEIAVLQTQMEDVKSTIGRIETSVNTLLERQESSGATFLTKADFEKYQLAQEVRMKALYKRTWVQNTLSAVAGALLLGIAAGFGYFIFIKK